MKIKKYSKVKGNLYKIVTDKEEYKLYDDIILKYELLLKKEIDEKEFQKVLKENNLLASYYDSLKAIGVRLRTKKELNTILKKKGFNNEEISYAINRLDKEGYLNSKVYIEAYIHDRLNLYLEGELKILKDLEKLGFKETEVRPFLEKVDHNIYLEKIEKYIGKKAKVNKKSVNEFKRKTLNELINKGFLKSDIMIYLDNIKLEENEEVIKKLVNNLYNKYIKKYDENIVMYKIRSALYQKGYTDIDINKYLEH